MSKVEKSDSEWRESLTDQQYAVCRCGGTEAPFSGQYWDTKTPGRYHCAACDTPLFDSSSKYDSGSGWLSFWAATAEDIITEKTDMGAFKNAVKEAAARASQRASDAMAGVRKRLPSSAPAAAPAAAPKAPTGVKKGAAGRTATARRQPPRRAKRG